MTHTVPLGRRSELQLACRVRCLFKSMPSRLERARADAPLSHSTDHRDSARGSSTYYLTRRQRTVVARHRWAPRWVLVGHAVSLPRRGTWQPLTVACRDARAATTSFAGCTESGFIGVESSVQHSSGSSQAACLVLRGVRACAQRPPPRLPHARRGVPAGLVDASHRDATSDAREAL